MRRGHPSRERTHRAGDPAGHEQHARDQDRAEDERPVVLEGGQRVVEHGDHRRAHDRSRHRPEPAENDHHHEVDRQEHVERVGRQETDEEGEEAAGHAGVERRHAEGERLVERDRHAAGLRGDLALANRQEGAADPAAREVHRAGHQHDRDGQGQIVARGVRGERPGAEPGDRHRKPSAPRVSAPRFRIASTMTKPKASVAIARYEAGQPQARHAEREPHDRRHEAGQQPAWRRRGSRARGA